VSLHLILIKKAALLSVSLLATQPLCLVSCRLTKQLDKALCPAVELAYARPMYPTLTADIRIRIRARVIRITRLGTAIRAIVPIAPRQQSKGMTQCSF
jgi:hypothetical protein